MMRKYKPKTSDLPERYRAGFLQRMDGRTDLARRLEFAFQNIVDDCGGAAGQSHLRLALIERAVFLEFALQRWERNILTGKASDEAIGRWIQATNSLLGLAKTLGLNRSKMTNAIDALYGPVGGPVAGSEGEDP